MVIQGGSAKKCKLLHFMDIVLFSISRSLLGKAVYAASTYDVSSSFHSVLDNAFSYDFIVNYMIITTIKFLVDFVFAYEVLVSS